jgi:hypothetical protein
VFYNRRSRETAPRLTSQPHTWRQHSKAGGVLAESWRTLTFLPLARPRERPHNPNATLGVENRQWRLTIYGGAR